MAVPLVTLNDLVENVKWIMSEQLGLEEAVAALTLTQVTNPIWALTNITTDERNEHLKKLTGCVVGSETDLNCYPLGLTTAILFDANGDPVT